MPNEHPHLTSVHPDQKGPTMLATMLAQPDEPEPGPRTAAAFASNDAGRQWARWVSATGPYLPIVAVVLYALGATANFVDVMLAKNVFDILVNSSEMLSWAIAAGISVLATILMTSVGIELRNGGRGHRVIGAILALSWLSLGATLAYLRFSEGTIRGHANSPKDAAITWMMLAMYIAAGLDIAATSYTLWNPRHVALLAAKNDLSFADRRLRRHTARRDRVQQTLLIMPASAGRLDAAYLAASGTIDEHEAELKGIARDLLTRAMADPTRSSTIYRKPHEPQPVEGPK